MTAADLRFEPEGHIYSTPQGHIVPSVTQILRATGVSLDFDAIRAMSRRKERVIDRKADLGTAVHADCHAWDDGDLDWSTVHDEVRPYVEAWAKFREALNLQPLMRERRVYHPTLNYCGTLDGLFKLPGTDEQLVLADIKTGDPHAAGAQYQTAAYELALREEHTLPTIIRWSVQLVPRASVPYRVFAHLDYLDGANWRSILTTYYLQHDRRSTHEPS